MSEAMVTVFEKFDDFLKYSHSDFAGMTTIYRFPNGYGASLSRTLTSKRKNATDWEVKLLDSNGPIFSKYTNKSEIEWFNRCFSFEYNRNDELIRWCLCEEDVEIILDEIMHLKETFRDKLMKFFNNLKGIRIFGT